jgi:hypothetical protein
LAACIFKNFRIEPRWVSALLGCKDSEAALVQEITWEPARQKLAWLAYAESINLFPDYLLASSKFETSHKINALRAPKASAAKPTDEKYALKPGAWISQDVVRG